MDLCILYCGGGYKNIFHAFVFCFVVYYVVVVVVVVVVLMVLVVVVLMVLMVGMRLL